MTRRRNARVLQVVLSLHPGGTERLVLDLVTRLHDDIPMTVCCLDDKGAWAEQLTSRGIEVTSLRRLPGFHPKLGSDIHAVARRHGATAIHAHHYSPFVYSCLARVWQPRTHLVFTEHGRVSDAPPSARRRLANRVFSRFPTRVCAVSGDLRDHIVQEGFAPSQVEVIYNGIHIRPTPPSGARAEVRARLGVDDGTLVVGTIARLDPVKDLGTLLDGAARAREVRPVRIVIIGDGPERAALHAHAVTLGIADDVTWLGHRDDARDWLPGCDVFVNCSTSEGVSLTILEAMAAALPVIATRVGGTPEVVTEGCGLLVPARNPGAIADALLLLASDVNLREAIGAAARQRVVDHFSLDRMVEDYRRIYMRSA